MDKDQSSRLDNENAVESMMAQAKYKLRKSVVISFCKMITLVALGFTAAIVYLSAGMDDRKLNFHTAVDHQEEVALSRLSTNPGIATREDRSNTVHGEAELKRVIQDLSNTRALSSQSIISSDSSLAKLVAEEYNYESTMRSCLGRICFDQTVGNTELVRIGLLGKF
jgi:hypothetical protein